MCHFPPVPSPRHNITSATSQPQNTLNTETSPLIIHRLNTQFFPTPHPPQPRSNKYGINLWPTWPLYKWNINKKDRSTFRCNQLTDSRFQPILSLMTFVPFHYLIAYTFIQIGQGAMGGGFCCLRKSCTYSLWNKSSKTAMLKILN